MFKLFKGSLVLPIFLLTVIFISHGIAAVPGRINYQGRLTDNSGNPVPDGHYTFTFSIYDVEVSGQPLWTEAQPEVLVINGVFNTTIPLDADSFPFPEDLFAGKSELFLGTQVGKDHEMNPRQPIISVPYSLKAGNADMLETKTLFDLDERYVNEGQVGVINSEMLVDGSIQSSNLASSSVGSDQIIDNSISSSKIIDNSLTDDDLAEDYVKMSGGTITGELVVHDITLTGTLVFSSPRYSSLNIPASAFIKQETLSSANTVWVINENGYAVTSALGTDNFVTAVAPVYLPAKAIITDVEVRYYDNDPVEDINLSCELRWINFYSTTIIYTPKVLSSIDVTTTGAIPMYIQKTNDDSIDYGWISPGPGDFGYSLFLTWNPTNTVSSPFHRFYGVKITYRVDRLD